MIPKIIHYCWLSDDPIPPNLQRCINSWKQYCPEYKIIKWDRVRFDINSIELVKEAYYTKKYAYAADYIRAYALYTMGGVYLDSDLMLYDNIDNLMDAKFISAIEYHTMKKDTKLNKTRLDNNFMRISQDIKIFGIGIQAAFLASEPQHPLLKKCLDFYHNITLAEILQKKYTAPTVLAYLAEEYGFRYLDKEQHLKENIHLFPTKIISHYDQITLKSKAVHYCAGSWTNKNFKHKLLSFIKSHRFLLTVYTKISKKFL